MRVKKQKKISNNVFCAVLADTNSLLSDVWTKSPSPAVILHKLSGRCPLILRDIARPRFRPLRIVSWEFVQNLEFAKLRLTCHPSSRATLLRYINRYGLLGHSFDMRLDLAGGKLRIRRPVCTDDGASYLVLEFLVKPIAIESINNCSQNTR